MEATFDQLMALFVAWREDIDSEPFAYEARRQAARDTYSTATTPTRARSPTTTLTYARTG